MPSMSIKKLTVHKGQRLKAEEVVTSKDYLVDKSLVSNKQDRRYSDPKARND